MRFDRRLLVYPAKFVLRLITFVALAAGIVGLVATLAAWLPVASSAPAWLQTLLSIPTRLAASVLPAAVVSLKLMPSTAAIGGPGDEAKPPVLFLVVVVGLCGIAAFQLAPLLAWWTENLGQVERLHGWDPDPLGLILVPTVLLISMPLLASAVMLTFVLTSILAAMSRTSVTFRVLASCVVLQAGLVLGAYLVMDGLRDVSAVVSDAIAATALPGEKDRLSADAAEWFGRQQALGDAVVRQLIWIVGGYTAALIASTFLGRKAAPNAAG